MNFNLVRPCAECPFRTDRPGYLRYGSAQQIVENLYNGKTFSCHKTVDYDDGVGQEVEATEHCAGAAIYLEHLERPNQLMRWFERLGFYDRTKLDMDAPVFKDAISMVRHHADSWKEKP